MEEEIRREFSEIKEEILSLKDSLKLKEEQIKTLKESLEFKNKKINELEEALKDRDFERKELIEQMKQKQHRIEKLKDTLSKNILEEQEKKIENLENTIIQLNEKLNKTEEILESKESEEIFSRGDIIDFTHLETSYQEILNKMDEILLKTLHSVNIVVPSINDLEKLSLYDIKSNILVKISCFIDPNKKQHTELFEEYQYSENISIRNYEREDKYIILRDNEELLFSIIGKKENNPLTFYTQDTEHIKAITPMVMDIWLRSKKI
jgi:DNA repair exonuclease SbcCD ATPase subunit